MAEPLAPEALEALHGLSLFGAPRHVVTAYQALLGEVDLLRDALTEFEELGTDAYAEKLLAEMRLRSLEIRDGSFEMDITEAREMAAMYVAMCRSMLGDAENYCETPLEFHVKIAEEPQKYIITIQRTGAGKLTPHEARQRAEAERDQALERVRELEATAPDDTWDLEDEQYDVLLGELVYDQCARPGQVEGIVERVRAEIEADELEDGPIHVLRTLQHIRTIGASR